MTKFFEWPYTELPQTGGNRGAADPQQIRQDLSQAMEMLSPTFTPFVQDGPPDLTDVSVARGNRGAARPALKDPPLNLTLLAMHIADASPSRLSRTSWWKILRRSW